MYYNISDGFCMQIKMCILAFVLYQQNYVKP